MPYFTACMPYFTVIVPFRIKGRTHWHPNDPTGPFSVLSRGAFRSSGEASDWAIEHLGPATDGEETNWTITMVTE